MKTCIQCGNDYNYISPVCVVQGKLENEVKTETKLQSYCSIGCMRAYCSSQEIQSNEYLIGSFPIQDISMCQFCGTFKHPSEICVDAVQLEGEDLETLCNNHQEIENTTGEWTKAKGHVLYIVHGNCIALEKTSIVMDAHLYKLSCNVEDRIPLVYFWMDDEGCKAVVDDMIDLETIRGELKTYKEFYIDIKPFSCKPTKDGTTTEIIYKTSKIINPHKLFFPFDIRQDNCWWALDQTTRTFKKSIHTSYETDDEIVGYFEYTEEDVDFKPEEKV